MNVKKTVALIIGVVALLVGVLMFLLFHSMSDSAQNSVGLLKGEDAETRPTPVTQEQIDEEYESRDEVPEGIMESIPSTVQSNLSTGRFKELDSKLKGWNETFKDNDDQRDDETAVIESYCADLAYYFSMTETGETLATWYFNNADVLAAVLAFAPISQKYQAFIDRDSALLPAARSDVHLTKAALTREETLQIMEPINSMRTEAGRFQAIAVYDMDLFDYKARMILVRDSTTFAWQPYSLTVNDVTFDVTARLADQILRVTPEANLDTIFVAPENLYKGDILNPSPSVSQVPVQSGELRTSGNGHDSVGAMETNTEQR